MMLDDQHPIRVLTAGGIELANTDSAVTRITWETPPVSVDPFPSNYKAPDNPYEGIEPSKPEVWHV